MCSLQKVKVLFLCTGNSCRSQMAEGWARHLKENIIEPYSAGCILLGIAPCRRWSLSGDISPEAMTVIPS